MKTRLWVAVIGLLAIFPSAGTAQEQIPDKAVVQGGSSGPLHAGENYTFQVVLDPPPQRYEEGWIEAWFECEPCSSDDLFVSDMGDQFRKVLAKPVKPQDDHKTYDMILPITEKMMPGKWKLTQLDITQDKPHIIAFSKVATFDIPPLHPIKLIGVQPPINAEAGHSFAIKVTVGDYPKDAYEDCAVYLGILLTPAPHEQAPNEAIKPDQTAYEFSSRYYSDAPGVRVEGEVTYGGAVVGSGDRLFGCRYPNLDGNRKFAFEITPAKDLRTPTSAEVTVNDKQAELLLRQAKLLEDKARQLEAQFNSESMASDQVLLQTNVHEAVADLDATEKIYREKGDTPTAEQAAKIKAFFDDIRFSYDEAIRVLAKASARASQTGPRLALANAIPTPRANGASDAVLASIHHNAQAFEIVATDKLLTFNLDVFSQPRGATISYRLRNSEYHSVDHETDWRIENLPRAVYFIRLQMPGYEDEERSFDAIANTGTSITFHLKRKTGAR